MPAARARTLLSILGREEEKIGVLFGAVLIEYGNHSKLSGLITMDKVGF